MARKKFGEFSTGHNCKCSKASCRESEAVSVRELSKEYPEYTKVFWILEMVVQTLLFVIGAE